MAASPWVAFDKAALNILNGTIDMDNAGAGAFKCALLLNTWTPDVTQDDYSDLSANEVATAFGYNAAGVALTGVALTEAAGVVKWTANTMAWTAAGGAIVARYAVIYHVASGKLICYCEPESGADKTATDGNQFAIQPNAAGILDITKA